MNTFIRNSIATISQLVPLPLLMKQRQLPPFLPFYHLVSNQKPDYINSYQMRNTEGFEKELDFLLRYYSPVALDEIIASPHKSKMHLSFDDGLKECHSLIAPILKRKGIPATFFVSPGFVDNKDLFHRFKRAILESKGILKAGGKKYFLHETEILDKLAAEYQIDFGQWKPYMTFDELKQLANDGFTIGAHSLNHPEMWLLSNDEQYRQVAESMNWVVKHFNPKVRAFSFPFTDDGIKHSLFNQIKKNGIVDVTFGTAGLKHDAVPFNLQRVPMERTGMNWNVSKGLHFEYFYCVIRRMFSANIVKRRL